ncbi:GNAT family N-acetyltransferase [Brachybacterium halotolerans subsp. kimchii]|uniref:GNAT family N-acetyltransferase n=1 Tax=Brachybacterium halotolerans TaxID=2795215 RepID=UPI001E5AA474|nr:GNAT family N-acetyltransferase [Brachybacterium halotolerans]UEJ84267.1 GNAT family N-acetyltransferase [Brachybacterium halotolerans subsp. kimchii]
MYLVVALTVAPRSNADREGALIGQTELVSDDDTFSTERLELSPLTPSDTEDVAELYSDPEVARYVGGERLTPQIIPQQVESFAAEWAERGYGQSAVRERGTGRFIGRIGLHFWEHWNEVELGYVLRADAQGRGFASEGSRAWIRRARDQGIAKRLIANIHPENAASIGLARKLGFAFEREDFVPSGLPTLIYRLDL